MKALLGILLLFGTAAVDAKSTVWITGPRLMLSDIAGAVDNDVDLGPAPRAGQMRKVPIGLISNYLSKKTKRHLPRFIRVKTRSQTLSCEELQLKLSSALKNELADGLSVQNIRCYASIELPKGAIALEAHILGKRKVGGVSVQVKLKIGEWPTRKLVVPATIDGFINVYRSDKNFRANETINRSSLIKERVKASSAPHDTLKDINSLSDYEVKHSLSRGQILRMSMLKRIPLIRRGSYVALTVILNGLRVSSRGQVRQDAALGDTVNVLCLKSRKILQARVVSQRRVVVDL